MKNKVFPFDEPPKEEAQKEIFVLMDVYLSTDEGRRKILETVINELKRGGRTNELKRLLK